MMRPPKRLAVSRPRIKPIHHLDLSYLQIRKQEQIETAHTKTSVHSMDGLLNIACCPPLPSDIPRGFLALIEKP